MKTISFWLWSPFRQLNSSGVGRFWVFLDIWSEFFPDLAWVLSFSEFEFFSKCPKIRPASCQEKCTTEKKFASWQTCCVADSESGLHLSVKPIRLPPHWTEKGCLYVLLEIRKGHILSHSLCLCPFISSPCSSLISNFRRFLDSWKWSSLTGNVLFLCQETKSERLRGSM